MLYYIIGRRDTGRGVTQCAAARRRRVSPEKLLSSGRECVGQKNKKNKVRGMGSRMRFGETNSTAHTPRKKGGYTIDVKCYRVGLCIQSNTRRTY